MAEFPTNPGRVDPYKNFNFRVKWDGQYIPASSASQAFFAPPA